MLEVYDFVRTYDTPADSYFPDPKFVGRKVKQACDRSQDGNLITETFVVPPGIRDVDPQTIVFEVRLLLLELSYFLLPVCLLLLLVANFFLAIC